VCPAHLTNGAVTCFSFAQDGHNLLFAKSLLHLQISFDLMIMLMILCRDSTNSSGPQYRVHSTLNAKEVGEIAVKDRRSGEAAQSIDVPGGASIAVCFQMA
jgi:hypothetical protein